jgi:hypothetical protein
MNYGEPRQFMLDKHLLGPFPFPAPNDEVSRLIWRHYLYFLYSLFTETLQIHELRNFYQVKRRDA